MAQQKIRKGKRKWYPIYAPTMFNNQLLGETFVYETETIPNKHLTINLMTLTGNPKKQNFDVFFKVIDLKEGKGVTKTLGIEMQHSSVRRLARRGRSKVADSFLVRTKKEEYVRIKPIIMTRSRTDNDTQSAIRMKARSLLRELIQKYNFETVVNDIINMRLQRHLKQELSDVFPVRSVDIRYLKYEKPPADDEEDVVEETDYVSEQETVKPRRVKQEDVVDSIQSLKAEVEESLAAEKEEVASKEAARSKQKKSGVEELAAELDSDDEDDEEEEK